MLSNLRYAAWVMFDLWLLFQTIGFCVFSHWLIRRIWANDIREPMIYRLIHCAGTKRPAGGHQSTTD